MTALRALVPVLALLLAAGPAAAQDVGVAAAVNQSALSTRPNAVIRTIGLGDNVIYNERIDTNDVGLVQLLLADGTTFTVGPNSSLVIDSFVYDPDAGTAQVAATLTKGVLRFIGAATSKTPDGVAITTPVGVVGIRGGVTDINMSPPAGIPPHISMIFGNSVTLMSGGEVLGRLFEAGFSLAAVGGGIDTLKTPAEWANQIQAALSSAPGQTGGAPQQPTNATVEESEVDDLNSGLTTAEAPIPRPPIDRSEHLGDDLIADLNDLPDDFHDSPVFTGYAGGLITVTEPRARTDAFALISLSTGLFTNFTNIAFDLNGDPVSGELTLVAITADCTNAVLCGGVVKIDPAGSTMTVFNDSAIFTMPVNADLVSHKDVVLPGGVNYCQCDFLRWGFWNLDGTFTDPNTGHTGHLDIDNGTWVVAKDLSTLEELNQLAGSLANTTATFNGHAVGTYTDDALGIGPTLTAGNMALGWSFGNRNGTVDINNFGGRDLHGNLTGDASIPGFFGDLSDGVNADGLIKGSFVNDGSVIAGGVMGDFFADDGSWTGSGIFMGERVP